MFPETLVFPLSLAIMIQHPSPATLRLHTVTDDGLETYEKSVAAEAWG